MTAVEYGDERLPPRFWSKVDQDGPVPPEHPELGPCWLWTATPNKDGYGRIRIRRDWAPLAHRALWELAVGEVVYPDELDHLCEVRGCVRPDHLEVVDHAENVRRGRGGAHWAAKTRCPENHPYDAENTRIDVKGARVCRTCATEHARLYRVAHPEKQREAVRRSRAKHLEQRKAYEREYREKNRDLINERRRAARVAARGKAA